jgi:hypothetical protein
MWPGFAFAASDSKMWVYDGFGHQVLTALVDHRKLGKLL